MTEDAGRSAVIGADGSEILINQGFDEALPFAAAKSGAGGKFEALPDLK